jgi:GMP synthase (glutamine-hydrolysing)
MGIPVLGICYGHQLIVDLCGGKVSLGEKNEYGISQATVDNPIGILKGFCGSQKVWMSHADAVYTLPSELQSIAHTENCTVAAMRHMAKSIHGLQWHPEVAHTENGVGMLWNFVFEICGCEANWTMEDFIDKAVAEIKLEIDGEKAIIALSGGVDSSVTAVLAAKAINRNLTAVFVDHGMMRENEPESVRKTFENFDVDFVSVDARKRFLEKLRGIVDPEQKRKIIGEEFIRVFEETAKNVRATYLLQGTIYPDRIESGFRRHSDRIKTHHNVAGLPDRIEFKGIVEPLKNLYKDEVRKVGEKLGIPKEIIWRQPFPGPGLAVRIVGEVSQEKINVVKKADAIVTKDMESKALKSLWQFFAVLIDTKSTGIKGDARAYGYTIAIRAVESKEAMTASFAKIPYDILEGISTRITNEIPNVSRVVYDITHKPPGTIEWE